jgi:hypothetical protein
MIAALEKLSIFLGSLSGISNFKSTHLINAYKPMKRSNGQAAQKSLGLSALKAPWDCAAGALPWVVHLRAAGARP